MCSLGPKYSLNAIRITETSSAMLLWNIGQFYILNPKAMVYANVYRVILNHVLGLSIDIISRKYN